MTRPAARSPGQASAQHANAVADSQADSSSAETSNGPDEDAKVIVRSNGTVGYVGKDIAYHLWKFGLLGRDFGYRKFFRYPNRHEVVDFGRSTAKPDHPHFGGVSEIYNVIDARQADPQNTVIEALAPARLHRPGRALHPFLLRNGCAHAALRHRTRLRGERGRSAAARISRFPAAKVLE